MNCCHKKVAHVGKAKWHTTEGNKRVASFFFFFPEGNRV